MHFYKHYLLRIFSYRNTGSSLCIGQSKPLLVQRPRPLLIVFQKGFQLSIKKYTMPTRSTLHSTACFYMALHCSTNLTNFFLAALLFSAISTKDTFYILKQIYDLLNNTRTKLYKTRFLQKTFFQQFTSTCRSDSQKGKNIQSCT